MDRAMPEHIAPSREGLMLIRSLGRLHLYTAFTCTISVPEALWQRGVATGITQTP